MLLRFCQFSRACFPSPVRTFARVSQIVSSCFQPMRTYLRIFNPLIALLVFVLCSFAAMKEDKDKPIVIRNVVAGGIPTYFFAKGMFCGVALILLGKILENQLGCDDR
jgi:hypothetical protein